MASCELKAVPIQRRQLEVGKPLILWRPAPGGGREALVCQVTACADPECPCPEIRLGGVLADEGLLSASTNARGNLCLTHAAGAGAEDTAGDHRTDPGAGWPLRTSIDVRSGFVRASPPTAAQAERQEDLLSWLGAELDGELLDHLHGELLAAKGMSGRRMTPDPSEIERSVREGNLLVAFQDLFPSERVDQVLLDGRTFLVVDSYCPDPDCMCEDVTISFVEIEVVERADAGPDTEEEVRESGLGEVGMVLVSPPYLEPSEIEPYGDSVTDACLRRLWRAFAERHGGRELLSRRRAALKGVAAATLALSAEQRLDEELDEGRRAVPVRRTNPRVGRNEPCPCGSGKKYKKCCLGKTPRGVSG